MTTTIPLDAFLAGATRFEWCCLDCPRLYVTHGGAIKHSIVKRHDYAGREDLAAYGFGHDEPHPFVACTTNHDIHGNSPPKPGWPREIVCGFCSWERDIHDVRQERLRPRLLAEFLWTLRALRKQKAFCGVAYIPP